MRKGMAIALLTLAAAGIGGGVALSASSDRPQAHAGAAAGPRTSTTASGSIRRARPTPREPRSHGASQATKKRHSGTTSTTIPKTIVKAAQAGCPVPPQPPAGPAPPPWHPAGLVPAASLPRLVPPAHWKSDVSVVRGKGMWIWLWSETDGGNAQAIVRQAVRAGLHSVWVRVADSRYGFYGASELDALVPVAHAAGLKVIAWGFPFLYDPVGDSRWTAQVLRWRSPGGQAVDGFSADLERYTEGVDMTAQRVGVYLELVRRIAGNRPIVATVYPPWDEFWYGNYPYRMMSRYVDAFAPMIYWECSDPGSDATADVARLATLRPVNIIGQAFSMAQYHGRVPAPSGAELTEFMEAGRKSGAIGASFWVWQDATPGEWNALRAYEWRPA